MGILRKIRTGYTLCLKAVLRILLGIFKITVEFVKIVLLVFSMILRLFTCFVRAGTP